MDKTVGAMRTPEAIVIISRKSMSAAGRFKPQPAVGVDRNQRPLRPSTGLASSQNSAETDDHP
jgi:hypothetical protein